MNRHIMTGNGDFDTYHSTILLDVERMLHAAYQLLGATNDDNAMIRQWLNWYSNEVASDDGRINKLFEKFVGYEE